MRPESKRIFGGFALGKHKSVIAAVSGGGDSLALLFLLKQFLDDLPVAPALTAVTVDHGLRREAADEARAVADLCRAHGIAHRTMAWRGQKPVSGMAAAARSARLALLAEAAGDCGATIVFTGHTRDDQAETVFMRGARGTGRGLAGMAPATLRDGAIWFARPLLALRRRALRAFLAGRGISWIDDPSNDDPAHERARVRRHLDDAAVAALAGQASDAAAERVALGVRAAALIAAHTSRIAPGLYRLETALLDAEDRAAALYALRLAAAMAGGTEQLAGLPQARTALDALRGGVCATLSRAVFDVRRAGIHVHRERRNLPSVDGVAGTTLWDGRYWIDGSAGLRIAAAGPASPSEPPGLPVPMAQDLVIAAQSTEPALWNGDAFAGWARRPAGLGGIRVPAPWARLMPSFDIAPANALIRLAGGETMIAMP